MSFAASEHRADLVNRVRRIWGDRDVARIDETQRRVGDTFFGTYQVDGFGGRIQIYAESSGVEIADRLSEFGQAFAFRVPVIRSFPGTPIKRVEHDVRRRDVGIADAE